LPVTALQQEPVALESPPYASQVRLTRSSPGHRLLTVGPADGGERVIMPERRVHLGDGNALISAPPGTPRGTGAARPFTS
jgi:hypothetical protein